MDNEVTKEGVRARWQEHWAAVKPRAIDDFLATRFTREAFAAIDRFIATDDRRILEAGCGTGRFCVLMGAAHPQATIVGTDLSPSAVRLAAEGAASRRVSNVTFQQGDIFALPFPDGAFDVVFSEGVLQHLPETGPHGYRVAMRELARVLRPGGKFVVSVINRACWPHTFYKRALRWMGRNYEYGHEKSYSRRGLAADFGAVGLQPMEFTGYYPTYALERLAWRASHRFPFSAVLLRGLARGVDGLAPRWVEERCGFELVGLARKPA